MIDCIECIFSRNDTSIYVRYMIVKMDFSQQIIHYVRLSIKIPFLSILLYFILGEIETTSLNPFLKIYHVYNIIYTVP